MHRKRTASGTSFISASLVSFFLIIYLERDKGVDTGPGSQDSGAGPQKRSRPNNNNGNSGRARHQPGQHALARKLLPIDHSGNDKSQRK